MENSYFIVYDFMVDELKLSGATLLVYALIYSFTNAESECYGSLEYIAERVGASRTTVYRSLKELTRKNYIIKGKAERIGKVSYIANRNVLFKNESTATSECNTEGFKTAPNNKEIKKEIITNYHSFTQEGAKRPICYFGPNKVVEMTLHQYTNLLRAFGISDTLRYIRILDEKILSAKPRAYKNHYKTIITWAREDCLVDENVERILAN